MNQKMPLGWVLVLGFLWGMGVQVEDAQASRRVRIIKAKQGAKIAAKELAYRPSAHKPYTEGWSLWGLSDNGWRVYATVFIARMHPFVGTRVGVQLTLISPSGKVLHRLAEYKKPMLTANSKQLDISVGSHRFSFRSGRGELVIDLPDVACKLRIERELPGFRLQGGKIRVGSRTFEGITFAPRARLRGILRWKQRPFDFQGVGYVDRSWQHAPHKIARQWYSARAFSKDFTVLISQMVPATGWSPANLASVSVAYQGKWLFHSHAHQLRSQFRESSVDDGSGYSVPGRVLLRGSAPGGWTVSLQVQHQEQIHRLDVLAHVPKVLRFFVQKLISKPYLFRYRAEITLTLKRAGRTIQAQLPALTEAVFLNP